MEEDLAPVMHGFRPPKPQLLLALKEEPGASLVQLAKRLGISRVATLRHLADLEREGLVERSLAPHGVGRPRHQFRLRKSARPLFPQGYVRLAVAALDRLEQEAGRGAVVGLLEERAGALLRTEKGRLAQPELPDRVKALAKIRTEEGYMAEYGGRRGAVCELREHNCPILAIADRFPEACEVERQTFAKLLHADVQTTHRVVNGDGVCRFLFRPRNGP